MTIPRARIVEDNAKTALIAPRALNDPVTCSDDASPALSELSQVIGIPKHVTLRAAPTPSSLLVVRVLRGWHRSRGCHRSGGRYG